MGGENHGRLYLLFVVVVASAADWQLLRVCECERARESDSEKERGKQKSVQAASLDIQTYTQLLI